jgi:hypothetical protein
VQSDRRSNRRELDSEVVYQVRRWSDGLSVFETDNLATARRIARSQGHDGIIERVQTGYAPVAYVYDVEAGGVCYNPRFQYGRDANFAAIPRVRRSSDPLGTRLCSHGHKSGCPKGCN